MKKACFISARVHCREKGRRHSNQDPETWSGVEPREGSNRSGELKRWATADCCLPPKWPVDREFETTTFSGWYDEATRPPSVIARINCQFFTHLPYSWKARFQTLSKMENMHHRWALMGTKLENDGPSVQSWPNDLRFACENCSSKGSPWNRNISPTRTLYVTARYIWILKSFQASSDRNTSHNNYSCANSRNVPKPFSYWLFYYFTLAKDAHWLLESSWYIFKLCGEQIPTAIIHCSFFASFCL